MTQNLVLTLLGCAVLRISAFSTTYMNYVKPGFRPFLIGAGVVLLVLGLTGLVQASRSRKGFPEAHAHGGAQDRSPDGARSRAQGHPPEHGHTHGGPRVAWLMCLPVFAIFLVAPPALGSFAAARSETPPPRDQALSAFTPLRGDGPVDMPIGEFIGRAWDDDSKSLTGRTVKLTGFVVPSKKKGQWYVTRMQIACCAADAFPLKVAVRGIQSPPPDTWVEVTGTWIPQTFGTMPNGVVYPQLSGTDLMRIDTPDEPYE
ncbi:TIGR03943 family putative permease subunit [Streptosporangium sp. NPDC003464]